MNTHSQCAACVQQYLACMVIVVVEPATADQGPAPISEDGRLV